MLKIALAELLFLHLVLKYQKLLLTFSGAILSIWLVASIFGFLLVSRFRSWLLKLINNL